MSITMLTVRGGKELVKLTGTQPLITKGFANVPLDAPGLGIELNDDNIKAMMPKDAVYFERYSQNGTDQANPVTSIDLRTRWILCNLILITGF
ncbi:MAG: hypothetical protein MZU84_00555 [Sphingobacterium sp.]|nr:hypothetical protein [Sphingobacterium sp.]